MSQKLTLAKNLRFSIGSDHSVKGSVSASAGEFTLGLEIIELLRLISEKKTDSGYGKSLRRSFQEILKNLPDDSEIHALLDDLKESGFLVSQNDSSKREDGFGDLWIQWAMITDSQRMKIYQSALESIGCEKKVVLDVGAGCGFLTAVALKAKATHVFSIEETAIAKEIIPFLKAAKLPYSSDKFHLEAKNSFDANLPENIDLIVSELFGNDPLQEGVIPTLRHLQEHFPNAQSLPHTLEVFVEIGEVKEHATCHRLKNFSNSKNDDNDIPTLLQKYVKKRLETSSISFPLSMISTQWERHSSPVKMFQINLTKLFPQKKIKDAVDSLMIQTTAEDNHCALIWFRVYLDGEKRFSLSSHPGEKDHAEHWSPIAIPLRECLKKGDIINVLGKISEEETAINASLTLDGKIIGLRHE